MSHFYVVKHFCFSCPKKTYICTVFHVFLMAGIYIHIPFCKSRCIYCGFFSTTSLALRNDYVQAVCRELALRRDYLQGASVETIYFGGGTPSQLSLRQLAVLFDAIYNIYNVRAREITVECNPDDVGRTEGHENFLAGLRRLGVNRLSMGVQTFDDDRLRFLHRRHTAKQAVSAVTQAQSAGFDNISIDLMFGFPGQTLPSWRQDVDKALTLNVQHLSAYSLMYEEGTKLERMVADGELAEIADEQSHAMYEYLLDATAEKGFTHYEISNFAQPGCQSRHNSGYWHGVPYLGVGAGAHSFDGKVRQHNADDLLAYIRGGEKGLYPSEQEVLTPAEQYDEFVFTALRTRQGLNLQMLNQRFGTDFHDYCMKNAAEHIRAGRLVRENNSLRLSRNGLFVSNDIMSDLMWAE